MLRVFNPWVNLGVVLEPSEITCTILCKRAFSEKIHAFRRFSKEVLDPKKFKMSNQKWQKWRVGVLKAGPGLGCGHRERKVERNQGDVKVSPWALLLVPAVPFEVSSRCQKGRRSVRDGGPLPLPRPVQVVAKPGCRY